jgi:deoxyribonuclease V
MIVKNLHPWDVGYKEAVSLQNELRGKLLSCDQYGQSPISVVAGADVSYTKKSDLFFAAVVLLDYRTMQIIEESSFITRSTFPYIPGLLSFREGPALLNAFERLSGIPDAVIFDGQGIAHPRGLGLASHMGLFLDVPSLGCAKTRLVGIHGEVGIDRGDAADLMFDDRVVGAVLRTKRNVKPVYISPGHKIGLRQAVEVALSSCRGYRIPEPVRQAHLLVNRLRREYSGE